MSQYIDPVKLKSIYIEHPLLFTIEFANHLIKKLQEFQNLKFTEEEAVAFLERFPEIFIK